MSDFKNWKPAYAIHKGYPFDCIQSKKLFAYRPEILLSEDNKPGIGVDLSVYPQTEKLGQWDADNKWNNFLLDRLVDFKSALEIAEDQIEALFEEKHFEPTEFGFELVVKPETVADNPTRMYISRLDSSYSLFRKPGNIEDPNWDTSIWTLMKKTEDGRFTEMELRFPCHRIAYATFFALGVQVEGADMTESPQKPQRNLWFFTLNTATDGVINGAAYDEDDKILERIGHLVESLISPEAAMSIDPESLHKEKAPMKRYLSSESVFREVPKEEDELTYSFEAMKDYAVNGPPEAPEADAEIFVLHEEHEEEDEQEPEELTGETKPCLKPGFHLFSVVVKRGEFEGTQVVAAEDEKMAKTKAKFLFETSDTPIADIKFEELTATLED